MGRLTFVAITIALVLCATVANAGLTCRDENNQPVDWFLYYKMPHFDIYFNSDDSGLNYAYVDANKYDSWKLDYHYINSTDTAFSYTLSQLTTETLKETASVFWNDSPLNTEYSWGYAHSKGFFVTEEDTGIYVPHSFPDFPSFLDDGSFNPYLSMQDVWFGNYMLCMNMSGSDINTLAENLRINFPRVFGGNFPESFGDNLPSVKDYLNEVPRPGVKGIIDLQSSGGLQFTNFAHNATMDVFFYEEVLAPYYDIDIMVEGWGRPYMKTFCKPEHAYNSMNIQYINFNVEEAFHFMSGRDHAKWQLSTDASKPYICLGDLNRMPGQNKRGGGTNCFKNVQLWNLFKQIAVVHEECDATSQNEEASFLFQERDMRYKP